MATVIFPTRTDGTQRYSLRCQLSGRTYGLEFRWNARDASWSFVISDATGNVLASKKIVVGFPLLVHAMNQRLPYGEFAALDTAGGNKDPGLTELGGRVLFTFTDVADFLSA
jgi:hypothetical protein